MFPFAGDSLQAVLLLVRVCVSRVRVMSKAATEAAVFANGSAEII